MNPRTAAHPAADDLPVKALQRKQDVPDNGAMPVPAPLFIRRLKSSRLLIGSVAFTVLILSLLLSALATFDVRVLARTAGSQLARSDTSAVVIGLVTAPQARADDPAIRAVMRGAFGRTGYSLHEAVWSDPLSFTSGATSAAAAEIAAPGDITGFAALTSGSWPEAAGGGPGSGADVPVAVPAAVASRAGLAPGAVFILKDSNNGARLRLRVTGVYRRLAATSPYWRLDDIWSCANVTQCFADPIVVSPGSFSPGHLAVDQVSWVTWPDTATIEPGDLEPLSARLSRAYSYLQSPALGGLVVTTSLPAELTGTRRSLSVAGAQLAIDALLLVLPAIVALTLAARLLAGHREGEAALLAARGAGRRQLAGVWLAEALTVATVSAAAGTLGGVWLASLLAGTGPLRGDATPGGEWVPPAAAWLGAAAVVLLCALIMVWPALRPPAVNEARVRSGRQAQAAGAVQAGMDISLLALGAVSMWELHAYAASGGLGTDPVLVIAPAVALAGLGVLPLRALPVLARALDRAAARSRRLTAAMASWELSRRPVRQSGPALLAILAVATGALALAQNASWHRSAADRAAFAAGADVRVDTPSPVAAARITGTPGVVAATAAAQIPMASGGVFVAIDARTAASTVLMRQDLSALAPAALWRRISGGAQGGAVPAIVTSAFLAANHLPGVGATADLSVGAPVITVRVAAVVTEFPTVTDPGGAVIADLSAVQRALAAGRHPGLPVTQWWLRTDGGRVPAGLRDGLPPGSAITDPAGQLAAVTSEPLSVAPQRAVQAIAVAAGLLAVVGFCVSIAASLRSRRIQAALLAALGARRRALAVQLALEQLMLTVPAALIGILAAAIISRLLVPAITLTPSGTAPFPPVLVEFPVGQAGLLALIVVAVAVLAPMVTAAVRLDTAARLRLAEAA